MSFGRPGRCTSPAEIIVVTPPFIVLVDPAELALARRPVAEHRMHVAVNQPGATQVFWQSTIEISADRCRSPSRGRPR